MNYQQLSKAQRRLLEALRDDMEASYRLEPGITLRDYALRLSDRLAREMHGLGRPIESIEASHDWWPR